MLPIRGDTPEKGKPTLYSTTHLPENFYFRPTDRQDHPVAGKTKMNHYQLAQINVTRMKGIDINDPVMKEFAENLDPVNAAAEASEGFVWRLKDDSNNATGLNPYNDEQVIINLSVWESMEALEKFMYKTSHAEFLRRRKEWFGRFGKAHTAMWWIPAGQYPTVQEAVDKLDYLQKNGATEEAFDFRNKFPAPETNVFNQ
jgi:hypothetical protein